MSKEPLLNVYAYHDNPETLDHFDVNNEVIAYPSACNRVRNWLSEEVPDNLTTEEYKGIRNGVPYTSFTVYYKGAHEMDETALCIRIMSDSGGKIELESEYLEDPNSRSSWRKTKYAAGSIDDVFIKAVEDVIHHYDDYGKNFRDDY